MHEDILHIYIWQENRESVEQFFAEYDKVWKKVFEESSEEEEEEKDKEEKHEDEEEEEEYVCAILKAKGEKPKNVKGLLMKDLAKILDVVNKERLQVVDIICTIKDSEQEKVKENISVMVLIQAGM